jgi:hypothetical protein
MVKGFAPMAEVNLVLPLPITVPIVPAQAEVDADFSTLTVDYYLDQPNVHKLSAKFAEIPFVVVLFEGAAYDAMPNWTDADVIARLEVLFPQKA